MADGLTTTELWCYSTLAVTIVTAGALFGPFFLPLLQMKNRVGVAVTAGLVSLGASVLLADAVLHLLPHAYGLHAHAHAHDDDHNATTLNGTGLGDEEDHDDTSLFIGLTFLAAVYLFFVCDRNLAPYAGMGHDHTHAAATDDEWTSVNTSSGTSNDLADGALETQVLLGEPTSEKEPEKVHVKPVAWLVLAGDAAHNIADGLAVAVSFAESAELGWATTVAVLCHEIPHEIGDFALLINAGMSPWRAIRFTALSQLTAFVGMAAGIGVSDVEGAETYLLSFTAGMFVYISMTSLLPEMSYSKTDTWPTVLARHVGIVTGVAVMVAVVFIEAGH